MIIIHRLETLLRDEEGGAALEYGMLAVFIAVVIIGTVALFGVSVGELFSKAGSSTANMAGK